MPKKKNRLQELAESNLADSGLEFSDVSSLGWEVLEGQETKKLGKQFDEIPSLYIPYFDPITKKPLKCLPHTPPIFQVRYLESKPGFAALTGKGARYMQLAGSGVGAYWCPSVEWSPILANASVPLLITEGEKKAIKAVLSGFMTIALGGVDSFGSKKEGLELTKDLEQVNWNTRTVYICYDSDVTRKPEVQRAMRRLAETLTLKGAFCYAVYLPDISGVDKTALDNFLRLRGPKALLDCFEEARAGGPITSPRSRHLMELNDKVIYIENPSHVINLRTGATMSVKVFSTENFADHLFPEEKLDAEGVLSPTGKLKSTAAEWIKWKGRYRASQRTYAPGQPDIIHGEHGLVFNSWPGLALHPVKGDIKPWLAYIDWLAGGDKELATQLHNWIGYPLKHLGAKLYVSLVLWSVTQGTGKTLLGELLSDIYGVHTNYSSVTEDELGSTYNSYIVGKQFILADECTGNDHRAYANKLKRMVTQSNVRVSEKYVPAYTVPDHANWLFTSNQPDAIFLDDGDRRFMVVELQGGRMPRELFDPLSNKPGLGEWRKAGGMAHVLHFYQHEWKFTGFDPTAPAYMTAAKLEMLEDGRSRHGAWIAELKRNPAEVLKLGGARVPVDWLTTADILKIYEAQNGGPGRLTATALGRELKKQGFIKSPMLWAGAGSKRLFLVQNVDKWTLKGRFTSNDGIIKKIQAHIQNGTLEKKKKY